ncbi:MAG: hypothetical protein JNJ94_16445 [Chlorobi bacterium]|nr:hypothetical protein [Chlorobiota bacterium]
MPLASLLCDPLLIYTRTVRFVGPEIARRYYRIFGDLEYDLLALRAEIVATGHLVRLLNQLFAGSQPIVPETERLIRHAAHEAAAREYQELEELRVATRSAKEFRYQAEQERECYCLLADIAEAIVGIEDTTRRRRHQETLTLACDAYGRLDVGTLTELHEMVQPLLSIARRERLGEAEEKEWHKRISELQNHPPLRLARYLADAAHITARMDELKRRIQRRTALLTRIELASASLLRHGRFRN